VNVATTLDREFDRTIERRLPTPREVELAVEYALAKARESFTAYRRFMRPQMKWGWFTQEVSRAYQQFYVDLKAGLRPVYVIEAPPQHGKTTATEDFVGWLGGKDPDLKQIFGSYSDELGTKTNLNVQRSMLHPQYARVFPKTKIGLPGWQCNTSLIEFGGHAGSFRNTTVRGGVNGMALDVGIVDDPIKGRREARSKQERDAIWGWFTDDFMGRFADTAGLIIHATRWNVDDVIGRATKAFPHARVFKFKAIATEDEKFRRAGDPLFPEFKSLEFLESRKTLLTDASWSSLYQQSPYVVGGGQLPVEKFRAVPFLDKSKILKSVRYFDKAGTAQADNEKAARTSGCLMHQMQDNQWVISNITKGRWGALEREDKIKAHAQNDAGWLFPYEVWVEQEPGSGGKESAEATIRNLSGLSVYAERVTGDKETRAEPFCAQVQGGNVGYVSGEWFDDFSEECESWPNGQFKDQVDSASGAFNKLATDNILEVYSRMGAMA
jgi:predicted phage terminase large subunit-like protein